MVVKVYISGISGNKEVKKRQQRVLLILDSRNIKYEVIDIAEPGNEEQKDFMQNNSTSPGATISDPNPRHPLPPQIFNDDVYCGDYDQFDMANEVDEMEKFLKLAPDDTAPVVTSNAEIKLGNGELKTNDNESEIIKNGDSKIINNDETPNKEADNNEKQEADIKGEENGVGDAPPSTQEEENKEENDEEGGEA